MSSAKTVFNWSGGKDSALALFKMKQNPQFSIEKLLTNVNAGLDRVAMHGVRRELMALQAESIGLPLATLELPENPTIDEYNDLTQQTFKSLLDEGFTDTVFGDIFLEDLKLYREEQLQPIGFNIHFPLWQANTRDLVLEFIGLGFKAVVVCAKSELLDKSFVGRTLDKDFISDLPENVDPCGENGEFHTFVYDGPIFKRPVPFSIGEMVFREYKAPKSIDTACPLSSETDSKRMGFWFCDLVPD